MAMHTDRSLKMKITIERAKRTRLGRMFCRLMGDESGAVAMEYVIIGTLVAAAAVVAVMAFGDAIKNAFNSMTGATAGSAETAAEEYQAGKAEAKKDISEADKHSDRFGDK
jgi:Flp pilus assembly pilin Flp